MSELLKEIKTFNDLTSRVNLFCSYAVDYYKYPNIDKIQTPFIAEELIRLYIKEIKDIFLVFKRLADVTHNFFHSIENPCYVIHPNSVALNVQIQLDERIGFYKEKNLRINENPILPYSSIEFFKTAVERTVDGIKNLHKQNFHAAIDKIRKESEVSDLFEIENQVKFSFIEKKKEITKDWLFFLDGLQVQIDYINKKSKALGANSHKELFNIHKVQKHMESVKEIILSDYIDWFLDVEKELLSLGILSKDYIWVDTKKKLLEFIKLLLTYEVLKKKRSSKEFHYRQYFSELYGFGKTGLTQLAMKYKPSDDLAKASFFGIKKP